MSQPETTPQGEQWQSAIRAIHAAEVELGNIPTGGALMSRFKQSIKRQKAMAKAGQGIRPVVSTWQNILGAVGDAR